MTRRGPLFAAFVLLLLASSAAAQGRPHVPGELIVGVAPGASPSQVDEVLARHGCARRGAADTRVLLVSFDPSIPATVMAGRLVAEPEIEYADPNYVGEGGFLPDDTFFGTQWHHDNTGQSGGTAGADLEAISAWDMTRGSATVTVAVLDTGIDTDHPDFAGRIVAGFDFVNEDADPEADHPHGAQVTGLLAANADNAFGVAGVDHFCSIQPVKVLDQNNAGTTFDLIQGLNFAAGTDIISMSLINYPNTPALQTALQNARDVGSILIACAGNGGIGNADVSFPGASPLTVSIGATDHDDVRASYSGTGAALDLVATGDQVVTVLFNSATDASSLFNGCSAATPVAAGVASLALSIDPTLGHDAMRQLLIDGSEDQVGDPAEDTAGRDDFYGFGRVNARLTLCQLDQQAPTALCPADAVAECSQPGGAPASDVLIQSFLQVASASDDLDGTPDVTTNAPPFFPLGATPVTFSAVDECEKNGDCVATLTVADTTAPTVACPLDLVIECNALGGVASNDPAIAAFLAAASASDVCDPSVAVDNDAPAIFGLGATPVTFTATDDAGNAGACLATVQVVDTTAPTVSATLDPSQLWPPNHKLVPIAASVEVIDVCDPAPGFVLSAITSSEPDNGLGDGNTASDIQGAAPGTADVAFGLRAERSGRGPGRVYTVTYTGSDASGNTAATSATVSVAHDRR